MQRYVINMPEWRVGRALEQLVRPGEKVFLSGGKTGNKAVEWLERLKKVYDEAGDKIIYRLVD